MIGRVKKILLNNSSGSKSDYTGTGSGTPFKIGNTQADEESKEQ